jgi:adenylate kinase family enzyme
MHGKSPNGSTLVPDETTMSAIKRDIADVPDNRNLIIDSLRSPQQVDILCDQILPQRGITEVYTIFFDAPRHICELRLRKRAESGERADDASDEVVQRRLNDYARYSPDTLERLRERTTFIDVDGTFKPLEVATIMLFKFSLKRTMSSQFAHHIASLTSNRSLEKVGC